MAGLIVLYPVSLLVPQWRLFRIEAGRFLLPLAGKGVERGIAFKVSALQRRGDRGDVPLMGHMRYKLRPQL